jgi:hypothetical protein
MDDGYILLLFVVCCCNFYDFSSSIFFFPFGISVSLGTRRARRVYSCVSLQPLTPLMACLLQVLLLSIVGCGPVCVFFFR